MTRARLLSIVLLVLAGGLSVLGAGAGPAAAAGPVTQDDAPAPLTVRIGAITPASLPASLSTTGPLVLTGSVTNGSTGTITGISAIPFLGSTPVTTRSQLAEQARSAAESPVGDRITSATSTVGDLAPGQSARFRIRITPAELRARLGAAPAAGAYWLGVHARATTTAEATRTTLGRARTFITVPPTGARTVAPVLSLRDAVRRDATGRVADPGELIDLVSPSGRLGRLVEFGAGAAPASVTWVVDPALLAAVSDLADGNPALRLGSSKDDDAGSPPSASPSPSGAAKTPWEKPAADPLTADQRATAKAWVEQTLSTIRTQTVLALPFGDPDVSAVARHRPHLLRLARSRSSSWLTDHDVTATAAVAPPDGWLAPKSLAALDDHTVLLLTDHGQSTDRPVTEAAGGGTVVRADSNTAEGGPSPTNALAPLALRQRIVAAAAVGDAAAAPLVVVLPSTWDPGSGSSGAAFFSALTQTWLSSRPLDPTTLTPPTGSSVELDYPRSARRQELPAANVDSAMSLVRAGTQLDQLVRAGGDVVAQMYGVALPSVGYASREDPGAARARVDTFTGETTDLLGRVRITGTRFAVLSGHDGRVTVSLVNDLPRPVTVGIAIRGEGVRISSPRQQTIGAGRRVTLPLDVHADRIGVHDVELVPVTVQGTPVGTPLEFSLRTSSVGKVIWLALLAALLVFVVALYRRIRQRIRTKDAGPGESADGSGSATDDVPASERAP